eukprot:TRINITY_DN3076_c0_g1_i1.p1 TRINITY_DN3076_c0_g1~~TRINITY_DN3076_c0_g1_i1.p1  ORF type:complete len:673 (+),score=195.76 TRINITY_DN3076_c0_g1_i1:78-2021(+)
MQVPMPGLEALITSSDSDLKGLDLVKRSSVKGIILPPRGGLIILNALVSDEMTHLRWLLQASELLAKERAGALPEPEPETETEKAEPEPEPAPTAKKAAAKPTPKTAARRGQPTQRTGRAPEANTSPSPTRRTSTGARAPVSRTAASPSPKPGARPTNRASPKPAAKAAKPAAKASRLTARQSPGARQASPSPSRRLSEPAKEEPTISAEEVPELKEQVQKEEVPKEEEVKEQSVSVPEESENEGAPKEEVGESVLVEAAPVQNPSKEETDEPAPIEAAPVPSKEEADEPVPVEATPVQEPPKEETNEPAPVEAAPVQEPPKEETNEPVPVEDVSIQEAKEPTPVKEESTEQATEKAPHENKDEATVSEQKPTELVGTSVDVVPDVHIDHDFQQRLYLFSATEEIKRINVKLEESKAFRVLTSADSRDFFAAINDFRRTSDDTAMVDAVSHVQETVSKHVQDASIEGVIYEDSLKQRKNDLIGAKKVLQKDRDYWKEKDGKVKEKKKKERKDVRAQSVPLSGRKEVLSPVQPYGRTPSPAAANHFAPFTPPNKKPHRLVPIEEKREGGMIHFGKLDGAFARLYRLPVKKEEQPPVVKEPVAKGPRLLPEQQQQQIDRLYALPAHKKKPLAPLRIERLRGPSRRGFVV